MAPDITARLSMSRARLLSHPALESAPSGKLSNPDNADPRLLQVLCAQLSDHPNVLQGLDPYVLADRTKLADVVRPASLSDNDWRSLFSKGTTTPLPDRALLQAVAQPPLQMPCFVPAANAVDAALIAASKARKALATVRRRARESAQKVETALSAAAVKQSSRTLPAEWANLGPRAENPSPPPHQAVDTTENEDETRNKAKRISPKEGRLRSAQGMASRCVFCPDIRHFGGEELDAELLGPFVNARGRASLYVHFDCGCWAPQVFADPRTSQFRGVYDEYRRGRQLRCAGCGGKGATVGCYVEKCKRTFHYRCLDGANARKVTEFFAAFCCSHAHLADKELYQIMMRASTIADVATARRESTDGLDAPHSKYTQLRRRDTEIVFSKTLGIASHSAVYDHGSTIFSSARRAVVRASERLRISDRVRVVRNSTLDVASGYLALLAIGKPRLDLEDEDICPTEARAAIASRHNSGLMLLRNLERAPRWTTDEISIAKPARKRSVHFNIRMRKHRSTQDDRNASGLSEVEAPTSVGSRKRKASELSLIGSDTSPRRAHGKSRRLSSVQLNGRLSASLRRTDSVPDTKTDDSVPRVSTATKVRTGWDVFLAEQLPRERAVRPDDKMNDAMNNMARMWGLLPSADRARYEASATKTPPAVNASSAASPDVQNSAPIIVAPLQNKSSAGLFGIGDRKQSETSPDEKREGNKGKTSTTKSAHDANRSSSFVLSSQRRRWRTLGNSTAAAPSEPVRNWDDIFPVDLSCALPSAVGSATRVELGKSNSTKHVLPPPKKQ